MSEAWIEIELCKTGGVFGCVGMAPEFRLDRSATECGPWSVLNTLRG